LAEVTSELGLPRNSVYRIAITLREAGFVDHEEATGRLTLSQKLVGLGFAAIGKRRLIEEARREMVAIRDAIKETTVLCVLNGTSMVIVDEVPGVHAFRFVIEPGHRTPLHASAQGQVVLAFLPEWYRDELLSKIRLTALTQHTITSRSRLREELKRVVERGYAVDLQAASEGVHCFSAPVFDHKGEVVAAITVTGPSERLRPEDGDQIGSLIRRHADSISERLGCIAHNAVADDEETPT
jgi:IclR family acetate operon transcriptional repressor